jgi:hypothetical protein
MICRRSSEAGTGGVGMAHGNLERAAPARHPVSFTTGGSYLEDDVRHTPGYARPHLGEQFATFNGELALGMGLITAERTLHDRVFQMIHLQEMVLPG